MPSAITPHHACVFRRAAATIPGARAEGGGIALNRWVNPVTPAASAASHCSNVAALCPAESTTPAACSRRSVSGATVSGASVSRTGP
jgi:hypothetical protein